MGRSDSPDPETRAFYGNLNERTRDYLAKGSVPIGEERPESGPVYDDVDYRYLSNTNTIPHGWAAR